MATKHRSNSKPAGGRIDTSPPQLLDHFEPLALKKPAMNRLCLRFSRRTLPSAASSLPSLRAALSHSCPLAAWTCSSIPRRIGDTYRRWSSNAPRHRPPRRCKPLRMVFVPVSDSSTFINSARTHGTLSSDSKFSVLRGFKRRNYV
jgi:hypothetical protein